MGTWFITCTEILANGQAGRTVWTAVRKRSRAMCEEVVRRHILGVRSVVATDAWKGYCRLSSFCRHKIVNHSLGFVAPDGTSTNAAEGIHGVIKRDMKRAHSKYGQGSRVLQRNSAVACVKYGNGAKDREQAWRWRLANLLVAMRESYDCGATDEMSRRTCSMRR